MKQLSATLSQLIGTPCWGVRHDQGAFVTLEFGTPRLDIRDGNPHAALPSQRRRKISVRGEWRLWLYACNWTYEESGELIAHNDSSAAGIAHALDRLDSQKLTRIHTSATTGATSFLFEASSRLSAQPLEPEEPLWHLYMPAGEVLSVRAGGWVNVSRDGTPCGEENWARLPEDFSTHAYHSSGLQMQLPNAAAWAGRIRRDLL